MIEVKKYYSLARNWNGDPCSPRQYSWQGLTCDYATANTNPRITRVNLSASGLRGGLDISFMKMASLENLDLSHNNLTGIIPDCQLNSLRVIDLSNNQLNGPIPDSILQRYKAGHLELRLEGNPICSKVKDRYCANKKNITAILPIAVIVPVVFIVLLVVLCILWKFCWKGKSEEQEDYTIYEEETLLHIDIRRFTYAELKLITNNFQSIIGKGGFGTVYHGILENNDEVAVKVLVETSIAESKDFLPEVQTLSKVHHKNLVALVGYCQNKKCLALVYDFMPRGNLQQLLSGGYDCSLNWEERLHIALDAAQGLEYLHESCTPSIVHRDVKTPNILLDKNLVAKISDFGLSRAFNAAHTHISTVVAGTLGYLDPEYHSTFQLTIKTDVYSFGIVLLEIVTGQPPVFMDPQTVHLPNWVRQKIAKGSIHDVVDKELLDQYDATHLQTVIDLAMNCLENASIDRPSMTEVVSVLKVCLPALSSEKQSAASTPRWKNVMDADIAKQFQLMISGATTTSYEGSSFRSGQKSLMVISYRYSAGTKLTWILSLQLILVATIQAQSASPTSDFLSIDCGLTNSSNYNDIVTNLTYVSDRGYVEGGKNCNIMPRYMNTARNDQEKTLRSFPDGQRNCYTLPSTSGKKYLIRAIFTYGNYDELSSSENGSPFLFGLHIGVNFWTVVDLTEWSSQRTVWKEVLTVAPNKFISVCLINFGYGTPFISALELRPLQDLMYPFVNTSVSTNYFSRLRFGSVDNTITRYPVDNYDRFWESWSVGHSSYAWLNLSTTREVRSLPGDDKFQVPSEILQKASTINSSISCLNITVSARNNLLGFRPLELLPIFHFAELDDNNNNSTKRVFDIYSENELLFPDFIPSLFWAESKHQDGQFLGRNVSTIFSLCKLPTSELSPLINAFEVYSLVRMDNHTTASNDVDYMKEVKKYYSLERNWNGDPCSPREYSWEGLTCDYATANPNPRITRVNLSASGLRGGLDISFMKMASLENLDLSRNNLTGTIPDYQLYSLRVIDLSNNQLNGSIPDSILQRYKAGQLELRFIPEPAGEPIEALQSEVLWNPSARSLRDSRRPPEAKSQANCEASLRAVFGISLRALSRVSFRVPLGCSSELVPGPSPAGSEAPFRRPPSGSPVRRPPSESLCSEVPPEATLRVKGAGSCPPGAQFGGPRFEGPQFGALSGALFGALLRACFEAPSGVHFEAFPPASSFGVSFSWSKPGIA
ncbi:hypothetical protein GUJ93_ZPchr0001g30539 [Zizania palustris]|nr:hypothetical protein GUJ93_ZPchr0001g30539 [Zizania palustris]